MNKIKILFLAADPSDSTRLRLGEELREIRERLQLSKQRDGFSLESRESVRPEDLTQAIFDVEPQIIHFSGHGTDTGELCFENSLGRTQPVSTVALTNLFGLVSNQVSCVILNACYSEIQAKAIAEHIPFVIGMNQAIGDKAAITFAVGFYKALGAGRSIEEAYKFACLEIQLQGISEHSTPVFYGKVGEAKPKQAPFTFQSFNAEDDLRSEKGIDYSDLRDLLKAGKWQEADDETLRVMLQIARRKKHGWLDLQSIEKLPHIDLRTIDALWVKYSGGKFGFSVQKRVYLSCCEKTDRRYVYYEDECWKKFGDAVGWRVNEKWIWHSEANFNISAPQGHLPIIFPKFTNPFDQAFMTGMITGYYNCPDDAFYTSPHSFLLLSRSDF
ncbi:GUN4 domain-containing protein [Alkalinema pantanalense CENA528]|uniref:GUN4 domain-containing protein n=1 Tax=Alkalinema pantanalense TaxID=1620705 RepID=UPI003D6FA190